MKKIFSIVLLLLVSFMMFVPSRVLGEDKQNSNATTGHTVEEVGMQIATWAIQFCNDEDAGKYTCLYNDNTNDDNGSPRSIAYNAQIAEGSTYEFDCVGWVSFAVHHATGIGNESFTIFASPTRYGWNSYNFNRGFYEEIWRNDAGVNGLPRDVTVLPGDILVMDGHVGLYVGKNSQGEDMVADMWSTASGGLGIRSAYTFSNCRGSQDNLKQIGRIHTYKEFLDTYNMARKVGFSNINVDLMIGLPQQKLEDVEKTIEEIIKLNPEHISAYSLIIEEGTPFAKKIESGELQLPDEEIERKMYWLVKKKLEEAGYSHYEISNFAKLGYESKHNTSCWNQDEYIGIGVAAHSYTNNVRYSTIESISEYINNFETNNESDNLIFHEKQNRESKMKEFMLLGLRKLKRNFYKGF